MERRRDPRGRVVNAAVRCGYCGQKATWSVVYDLVDGLIA